MWVAGRKERQKREACVVFQQDREVTSLGAAVGVGVPGVYVVKSRGGAR